MAVLEEIGLTAISRKFQCSDDMRKGCRSFNVYILMLQSSLITYLYKDIET
jgi:hypothetical protein